MHTENEHCPFCDSGELIEKILSKEIELEGSIVVLVDTLFSICNNCAMETVTPHQSRINKRTIINAQKNAQGLLTAQEINSLRKQLGLTQAEAAKLLGGGINAFSKYETNSIVQTKAMDNVLRLVRDVAGAAEYLAKRENVQLRSIAPAMHHNVSEIITGNLDRQNFVNSFGGGNFYSHSHNDPSLMQITSNSLANEEAANSHVFVTKTNNFVHYSS